MDDILRNTVENSLLSDNRDNFANILYTLLPVHARNKLLDGNKITVINDAEEFPGSNKYSVQCIITNSQNAGLAQDIFSYAEYTIPRYLDIDPSKTTYSAEEHYAAYIRYAFDADFGIPIISFNEYTSYGNTWKEYIPDHFVYAMINESIIQNVPMEYIYSISRHETINYKFFKSLTANVNGSVDHGLMGLNDKNFDDTTQSGRYFLDKFYYYDGTTSRFNHNNQFHILKVCVKYFKELKEESGSYWNACMAYNGGLSRVLRGNPKPEVVRYATKIFNIRNTVRHLSFDVSNKAKNTDFQFDFIQYDMLNVIKSSINTELLMPQFDIYINHVAIRNKNLYIIFSSHIEDLLIALWYSLEYLVVNHVEVIVCGGEYIGQISDSGNYIILG
jgi:hypothetical protein